MALVTLGVVVRHLVLLTMLSGKGDRVGVVLILLDELKLLADDFADLCG